MMNRAEMNTDMLEQVNGGGKYAYDPFGDRDDYWENIPAAPEVVETPKVQEVVKPKKRTLKDKWRHHLR